MVVILIDLYQRDDLLKGALTEIIHTIGRLH
jgi:hypothetical protein